MPFQGHAFRALTPEEASPFGNIIQNMMRDYQNAVKSAYVKPTLAEELKKAQLARKKSELALSQQQLANQYLPGKLEADAKMREFKLKHPYMNMPGAAGQIASLMAMANDPEMAKQFETLGITPMGNVLPQQPMAERQTMQTSIEPAVSQMSAKVNPFTTLAQSMIQKELGMRTKPQALSNTAKEINELEDIKAGFKPGTNRQEKLSETQQQIMQRALEAKAGGLPKGHFYEHDEEGNVVGESRPKTQKEKDIDRGTVLFDTFYPEVNKGLNYYSGFDSISRLENDARNYSRDKNARQRFDDFLLAYKLKTVTGISEAARFGAGRTNQTYNRFFETLTDLDVPRTIQKLIKNYQVINKANVKAGNRFHNMLTKAQRLYEKNAQPNVTEYYPGMAPNQNQMELEDPLGIR
jgi:hypothetical protein